MADTKFVGFIGAGMMASALMDGIIAKNIATPKTVICSDIWQPSLDAATKKGIRATKSNEEVCKNAADVIIIAVKPFAVGDVCKDIASVTRPTLIISIAAGVTLETLESQLPGRKVVRVMPNTPCLVGQAASGYTMGSLCTDRDRATVESIFGAVGTIKEIKQEVLLNAVTGLSGSGPAYVYQFMEALADGGVRSGLPRDVALQLAAQTVKGAAEMVLKTGTHPGQLKDNVCSPGGTTISGVEALEKGGLRTATISAVMAATKRSMQLGNISEEEIQHVHNL